MNDFVSSSLSNNITDHTICCCCQRPETGTKEPKNSSHDRPDTQAIILDDAFQHRIVNAGLNILLTDYNNLFTRDFFLPTGDLRDQRSSSKRAQIIIVTKCKNDLTDEERMKIVKEINPLPHQQVFFTCISYGTPYHITKRDFRFFDERTEVLLVAGIANPRPLKTFLEERIETYYMFVPAKRTAITVNGVMMQP